MIRAILCAVASLSILWVSPDPVDACGVKLSVGSPSKMRRNLVSARQPLVPKRRKEERTPVRTGPMLGARGPALTSGGESSAKPAGEPVVEPQPQPQPADVKPKAKRRPKVTEPAPDSTDDSASTEPAVAKTGPTPPEKDTTPDEGTAPREVKGKGKLASRGFFGNASAKLNPTLKARLDETARWLAKNPDKNITVEGHTSTVGNATLNQQLSERRAEAVKDYLVEQGVDASRITARGAGPDKPAYSPGRNPKNRRVEITVD